MQLHLWTSLSCIALYLFPFLIIYMGIKVRHLKSLPAVHVGNEALSCVQTPSLHVASQSAGIEQLRASKPVPHENVMAVPSR